MGGVAVLAVGRVWLSRRGMSVAVPAVGRRPRAGRTDREPRRATTQPMVIRPGPPDDAARRAACHRRPGPNIPDRPGWSGEAGDATVAWPTPWPCGERSAGWPGRAGNAVWVGLADAPGHAGPPYGPHAAHWPSVHRTGSRSERASHADGLLADGRGAVGVPGKGMSAPYPASRAISLTRLPAQGHPASRLLLSPVTRARKSAPATAMGVPGPAERRPVDGTRCLDGGPADGTAVPRHPLVNANCRARWPDHAVGSGDGTCAASRPAHRRHRPAPGVCRPCSRTSGAAFAAAP